ncbi:14769_t:CDS:2 [Dentiscutata heterogama]|uniref:14769_t:CDS:1 n=1 Tax=Dentiscutata heterogama TaxID=1316150 RepID=A0ACA9JY88_9GLOM|nr:14769_t:CDS:2 [Dentiscutata heterogama]
MLDCTENVFFEGINDSNNSAKVDNISIDLEQIVISEKNKERKSREHAKKRSQESKSGKSLERKAKISAQLPKLPNFN